MERLAVSAAELGLPPPPAPSILIRVLERVLAAEQLTDAVARITVTRGVSTGSSYRRSGRGAEELPLRLGCWVEVEALEDRLWRGNRTGRAKVMYSRHPFEPGSLGRHKTTSRLAYDLAREEAQAEGADEALLVSPVGEVLEGTVSNVFAVFQGVIRTPPLASGILPGITRAWVIETSANLGLPIEESTICGDELLVAEEVFLTNSVQEVVPVVDLEGHPVPRQVIGDQLREAYHQAVSGAVQQSAK
jgi:branched-subunit amino acid aminotransferase/4-amino-4-deoxychorismate lyase